MELGNTNAALAIQLAQIQTQLGEMQNQISTRLDRMDARISASNARNYNSVYLAHLSLKEEEYHPVVKYTHGHPAGIRLNVPNVQFQPEYPVGSNPPDNLIPPRFNEIERLATDDNVTLRSRLRAIYWFYNEPRLELNPDAGLDACRHHLFVLELFLKFP